MLVQVTCLDAKFQKKSQLGLKIKDLIDNGSLVDDETVLNLFKNNLDLSSNSYIMDGFPRTLKQCRMLDSELLEGANYCAIYFEIDEPKVIERIINRRIAPKSGKIYNLLFDPPQNPGVCDVSGERLVHRDDDKEDVVKNRLSIYRKSVEDILGYYSKSSKLKKVDASSSPELVYEEILKIIN